MYGLLFIHMNVRGFLLVKVIKMNSLFVCDLAQIALYWSVHSRDGWIQKILFPRNVCVCVSERISVQCVAVWLWIHKWFRMGREETTKWNLLKTLLGFGLSQQAMIGELRVPPGRWTLGDHRVVHPTQTDMETALGCWARRLVGVVGENKIRCTSTHTNTHTYTKSVSQHQTQFHHEQKRKERRPGGLEKCLWARFVKTCYFDGTMFTQRNTYWESDCAGRIWKWSCFYCHQTHITSKQLR